MSGLSSQAPRNRQAGNGSGPRPLPPNVRLFNRIVLIVLLCLLVFQCGRCVFSPSEPSQDSASGDTSSTDSLPAESSEEESDSEAVAIAEVPDTPTDGMPIHVASQRDPGLAHRIDELLRAYKPDHAFVLLVDGRSNEILAWGQRTDDSISTLPTFLKRTTFPAASLIKIVTAAAALESHRYNADSELPMVGRAHTLYNNQLHIKPGYKGPTTSLADAFALSNNPVMGRIGLLMGGRNLGKYGNMLGFNRHFPNDIPHMSVFLPPDTGYGLAEAASGFTRANTLSPLHAAAIVRSLVVRRLLELPWSQKMPADTFALSKPLPIPGTKFSPSTYAGLRRMFLRTVTEGTSRKSMRRVVYSYNREGLDIGGKTGSLDGTNPEGRYDWFAGFAQYKKDPSQSLILVVMQVHGKYRNQSSTSIAGQLINHWAKYNLKGK